MTEKISLTGKMMPVGRINWKRSRLTVAVSRVLSYPKRLKNTLLSYQIHYGRPWSAFRRHLRWCLPNSIRSLNCMIVSWS
jgi:hypothetical protein